LKEEIVRKVRGKVRNEAEMSTHAKIFEELKDTHSIHCSDYLPQRPAVQ
jgi:hypothetical protein